MDTRGSTLLPTTPESYSQLLKRSIVLYRASFYRVFLVSLLLGVVVFIPRFMSLAIGEDLYADQATFSFSRLWLLLVNLASLTVFIALIFRIYCVVRNVHEPFVQDLSTGLRRLLNVFFATIIESIFILAAIFTVILLQFVMIRYMTLDPNNSFQAFLMGLLLLGQALLIIYVTTLFIFIIPIIAVENKHILYAISRSVSLVWNHWWRVFSLQMTPWLFFSAILFLLKFLHVDLNIYFFYDEANTLSGTLVNLLFFALLAPWAANLLLIQLKDLENRKALSKK